MHSKTSHPLSWQIEQSKLKIIGELTRDTLQSLYNEKKEFNSIETIDVSGLTHVDSSGLALLTQICLLEKGKKKKLDGTNSKLDSLIQAYRLPL